MDIKVRGSKGTLLAEDDDVTLIKDLKPKGSSTVLERGTMIGNIQLTDDPAEIEGRTDNIKRQASGAACGVFEEGMTDGVETIVRLCKPGLIVRRYFWLARLINERGNRVSSRIFGSRNASFASGQTP